MSKKEKKEKKKNNYIKIILLGESSVGKTNLINVYCGNKFMEQGFTTLSNRNETIKIIKINDKELKVGLWDTVGQEKFRSITKTFIRGSHIVIFVYDVTRIETFLELNYWFNSTLEELGDENVIFGVVGNKCDLIEKIEVDKDEAESYATSKNASFYETSAKEDVEGFKNYVNKLVENLIKNNNFMIEEQNLNNKDEGNINLNKDKMDKTDKKEKKGCCK